LQPIIDALDDKMPLFALGLADTNLDQASLAPLMPALVRLPNLRFIDLSHNKKLFSTEPNAVNLLRKYLPRMKILKRLHLMDVDIAPEQAIALAEILPEIPNLAHLSLLDNQKITALANAPKGTGHDEESLALYASLMSAAKVSKTIIALDVDVPGEEANDIIKALAKQTVAYCLRNLEAHAADFGTIKLPPVIKTVRREEAIRHLVGNEDFDSEGEDDIPATDEDYMLGGTAIIKALGICLGSLTDPRKASADISATGSGTITPTLDSEASVKKEVKAMEMSKNLLFAARRIKARLQPALTPEHDDMNYRKFIYYWRF
jgi:hypothetical protein